MKTFPVVFKFSDVFTEDGEVIKAMVPLARYGNVCARQFMENEEYPMVVLEARSRASHSHFFAALHDGWSNLPETEKRFPTPEHLRKWALCHTGFCVEKNFVCETPSHARRLAAFIRSIDTYGVITLQGNVVRIFEAESQSAAAMGKEKFQASKKAILELIESMVGVDPGTLKKQAGRGA